MAKDHGLKQVACPYCKTVFWTSPDPSVPVTAVQRRALDIIALLSTHESIANDYLDRLWVAGTDALMAQIAAAFDGFSQDEIAKLRSDLMALMPPRTVAGETT